MEQSLVTSLFLAALSGLTFVAYKHPPAYKRLYLPIFVVITAILACGLAWNISITTVLSSIKEFIPEEKLPAALAKAHSFDVPSWVLGWPYTVSMLYMAFLLWLPEILHDSEKTKQKDETLEKHNNE